MKKCFYLLLWLYLVTINPAHSETLSESWLKQVDEELTGVEYLLDSLKIEVTRLEGELKVATEKVEANPDCLDLDCEDLKQLAQVMTEVDATAQASIRLSLIATEQWQRYADNHDGTISAIRKGKQDLEDVLFYQQFAAQTAELAGLMATGLYSAQKKIVTQGVNSGKTLQAASTQAWDDYTPYIAKMAETSANYAFNKGLNEATGLHDQGAELASGGMQRDNLVKGFMDSASRSLGSQLSRVAVVEISNGRMLLSPRMAALPQDRFKAASLGAQAVIKVATDPWIKETEQQVAAAQRELGEAIQAQQDAILVIAMQKVLTLRLQELRRDTLALADRISSLRDLCRYELAQKKCYENYEAQLEEIDAAYGAATNEARARRDKASNALMTARGQWQQAFDIAAKTHERLRRLKAEFSEAQQLQLNRKKIEELAVQASDPEVREKYREQLKRLQSMPPENEQRELIKLVGQARLKAWQEMDNLEQTIKQLSDTALSVYSETDASFEKAADVRRKALTKSYNTLIDCLNITPTQFSLSVPPSDSLSQVRKQQLNLMTDTAKLFAALRSKLNEMQSLIGKSGIGLSKKDLPVCRDVNDAVGSLSGCWQVGGSGGFVWALRQQDNGATASVYQASDWFAGNNTQEYVVSRLSGRFEDPYLDMRAAGYSAVQDWRNNVAKVEEIEGMEGFNPGYDFGYRLKAVKNNDEVSYFGGTHWDLSAPMIFSDGGAIYPGVIPDTGSVESYTQYYEKHVTVAGGLRFPIDAERLKPGEIKQIYITDEYYKARYKTQPYGKSLWLEIEAEDTCPIVRDRLRVEIVSSAWPEMLVAELVETGPGTGRFRSVPQGLEVEVFQPGFTDELWRLTYVDTNTPVTLQIELLTRNGSHRHEVEVSDIQLPAASDPYNMMTPEAMMIEPGGMGYDDSLQMLESLSLMGEGESGKALFEDRFMRHAVKAHGRMEMLFAGYISEAKAVERGIDVSLSADISENIRAQLLTEKAFMREFQSELHNWQRQYEVLARAEPTGVANENLWSHKIERELELLENMVNHFDSMQYPQGVNYPALLADNLRGIQDFYRIEVFWLMGLESAENASPAFEVFEPALPKPVP